MGWEDRSYYRDGRQANDPVSAVLNGSLPLFTFRGIRVRVHATLLIFIASVLLFGLGKGFSLEDRVESMAILFGIVLVHEFGHCFAARSVGGNAEEVMMTPLGGLAFAYAPRKPYPQFITVAGGPAVNVAICIICAALLYSLGGAVSWHPFHPFGYAAGRWALLGWHVGWIFTISYLLLLFNLLPIFPLDGGQMLQAALWPKMGYYRSMNLACLIGLPASIAIAVFALATQQWLLLFIMLWTAYTCFSVRRQLQAAGPGDFAAEDEMDYGASIYATEASPKKQHKRLSRRKIRRLRMQAQREAAEQGRIDAILAKVSAQGMHSLTWLEKRALRRATERQRKHDLELTRGK
jgi:Zn-dependent protease